MRISVSGQFEKIPVQMAIARCFQLVDLGHQAVTYQGETSLKPLVRIGWELPEIFMEGKYNPELKGKPFVIWNRYTKSLHEKAGLRKMLESWKGKKLTAEDLEDFDLKKILGKVCTLAFKDSDDGSTKYISSVLSAPENHPCPAPINAPLFFSLQPDEFDNTVFEKLGEKTKEKIKSTMEFLSLPASNGLKQIESEPVEGEEVPF